MALLVTVILVGLIFDFINGFHDAASRALPFARAGESHRLAVHMTRRASRHMGADRCRPHAMRRKFRTSLRQALLAFVDHGRSLPGRLGLLGFSAHDIGAESAQLAHVVLVTAIDMADYYDTFIYPMARW